MTRTTRRLTMVAGVLAAYGAIRLVFNIVGLRTIGADSVGGVNLALSFGMLVSLPATSGIAAVLSLYMPLVPAGDAAAAAKLRRWALARALIWTAPVAAVALAVFLRADAGRGASATNIGLLTLLWGALYSVYMLTRADLFAQGKMALALRLEIAGLVLFAGGMAVLLASRGAAWIPFTLYYLPASGFMLCALVRDGRHLVDMPAARGARRTNPRVAALPFPRRELTRIALFALTGSLASLGIGYLSTIVVSASSGLARAGVWATLLSVVAPVLLAPRTLNSTFLPRLSALGRTSLEAFAALSGLHQRLSSLLALLSVGAALALSRPALALTLGDAAPSPDHLMAWKLLCLASYGIFRGEPWVTAVSALGRVGMTAGASFAGACVCLAAWAVLVPGGGLTGVAAGYAIFTLLTPVLVAGASRFLRRRPSPRMRLYPSDAVFALVGAAALTGRLESAPRAALALAVIAAVAGMEGFRARRDLRAVEANESAERALPSDDSDDGGARGSAAAAVAAGELPAPPIA